ncbi:hypothetical protein G3480_16720 [Thiorhodococcus mannitoliphagus]|uniref:Uncharacterized protein n=1 Tax=Thiorhodococcus mannitoliphagus TaxID=329406 RepID=A0A6P1DV04_9GAMM|nr:hypothetical protein [Thiorhodococcus mannitoliphagus]NEX21928.1 hypothetical protein [Thiorhodococcus mannitoliphagus]
MNAAHTPQMYPVRVRYAPWLVYAIALSVLTACASSGDHVTGVMQVSIKPGDTANCDSSPCQVTFQMPPGSGTYEVTGNQTKIGDFPAGQSVSLGGFYQSNAIKVVGANVPPAYVYVPSNP